MDPKQKRCADNEILTKDGCRLTDIHRTLENDYGDDRIERVMCKDG